MRAVLVILANRLPLLSAMTFLTVLAVALMPATLWRAARASRELVACQERLHHVAAAVLSLRAASGQLPVGRTEHGRVADATEAVEVSRAALLLAGSALGLERSSLTCPHAHGAHGEVTGIDAYDWAAPAESASERVVLAERGVHHRERRVPIARLDGSVALAAMAPGNASGRRTVGDRGGAIANVAEDPLPAAIGAPELPWSDNIFDDLGDGIAGSDAPNADGLAVGAGSPYRVWVK